MSHERNSVYVVVILIALLGVLLSCCVGMFGGFMAGGWQARVVARRLARFESEHYVFPPGRGVPEEGEKPPSRSPRVFPTPEAGFPPEEEFPLDEILPQEFWDEGYSGGALVLEVNPGSPAERAGFRKSDVIVAVDGEALTPDELLSDAITALKPGDKAEINYWRRGRERFVIVTLGENPENADQAYLGVLFVPVPPLESVEEYD